ncbi:hypothetical protein E2C01_079445 [Portunus trituberculatus]|uniref:Uncharacterized protein n=1 Tax=Portunus trituberculatus TaxID=210409 RepID=A0A5B7IRF8_PORTR|nr:hypothetical protein [Portunus trituberculatus]
MMAILWESWFTSSMECDVSSTERLSCDTLCIARHTSRRDAGSMPLCAGKGGVTSEEIQAHVVGSSISTRRGLPSSDNATDTFLLLPPDRCRT